MGLPRPVYTENIQTILDSHYFDVKHTLITFAGI